MDAPRSESPRERFERSMDIGYEDWPDGIGYDLDAIAAASPAERSAIEGLLLPRSDRPMTQVAPRA